MQLFGTKVDDATVDGPDVGIRLTVLQADRWNAEPGGGSIGEEQIRPVADPRSDRVLEQLVGDVDRWTEQLASGSNGLLHEVATVEDHLQVKVARDGASRADVIGRLLALLASRAERPVDSLQMTEDRVAPPVEGFGRRHGEDGIALELGDSEVGLHALDDGVQQLTHEAVSSRDP